MTKKRFILLPILLLFAMTIALPALAIPTADVDDSYTKLLLHADGADASTAILDESGKTATVYGNAQLDTDQYKFGNASLLLDGTGDYITFADSDDFDLGTNDFTIDFWVRFNALPDVSNYVAIFEMREDSTNYISYVLSNNAGTYLWELYARNPSGFYLLQNKSTTLMTNTWYHIAFVRSGSTFYYFQDGISIGTATDTDSINDISSSLKIGTYAGTKFINGWIDEYRFTNGVARWTENFTPPSEHYYPTPTPTDMPTDTPTPTNTPILYTDTPTARPPYAEATAYVDSRITYGEVAMTASLAGLCLVIILIALIALGLYIGQRKGKR